MKTIYLDSDFRCHLNPDESMFAANTDIFDGKCDEYIEGHRYIPEGMTWTREDGVIFHGEMKSPWVSTKKLDAAQRVYEQQLVRELTAENAELLEAMAAMVDDVYNQDLGEMEG